MNTPFPLGRNEIPDSRDALYPMRAAIPKKIVYRSKKWKLGPVLSQSAASSACPGCINKTFPHAPYCCEHGFCVGYATRGFLDAQPIRTIDGPSPLEIYHSAQAIDTWPGVEYAGTSVRAGVQYLRSKGHVEQFLWGNTAQDVADYVRTMGTVILGIDWHESMFWPDAATQYVIKPEGPIAGGHALLCAWFWLQKTIGGKTFKNLFKLRNSWGDDWGDRGDAYIEFADLDKLLRNGGDACAPIEKKVIKI
jgi:hypothetical protein